MSWFSAPAERWVWAILFLSFFAVTIGSSYYHLAPTNQTLFWDRLPMAVAFMSLTAIIIGERYKRFPLILLYSCCLALGILSVCYWRYTESIGAGDLRPYILVQFLPLIVIPCMLLLKPVVFRKPLYIFYALGCYALAKVFEFGDTFIFDLTHRVISGHTIKHLSAAMSCWFLLRYFGRSSKSSYLK